MEYKDYYKTLGVSRSATADENQEGLSPSGAQISSDVSKEANAEARFKEVQEAYEVLKDTEKRAAYDQLGSNWQQGQQFRPPPDWASGFEFRGGRSGGQAQDFEGGGFSDFFSSLFVAVKIARLRVGNFRKAARAGAAPARQPCAHRSGFGGNLFRAARVRLKLQHPETAADARFSCATTQ